MREVESLIEESKKAIADDEDDEEEEEDEEAEESDEDAVNLHTHEDQAQRHMQNRHGQTSMGGVPKKSKVVQIAGAKKNKKRQQDYEDENDEDDQDGEDDEEEDEDNDNEDDEEEDEEEDEDDEDMDESERERRQRARERVRAQMPTRRKKKFEVNYTVGRIEDGNAVLLSSVHNILDVPLMLLPKNIKPGNILKFRVERNLEMERKRESEIMSIQKQILEDPNFFTNL